MFPREANALVTQWHLTWHPSTCFGADRSFTCHATPIPRMVRPCVLTSDVCACQRVIVYVASAPRLRFNPHLVFFVLFLLSSFFFSFFLSCVQKSLTNLKRALVGDAYTRERAARFGQLCTNLYARYAQLRRPCSSQKRARSTGNTAAHAGVSYVGYLQLFFIYLLRSVAQ